MGIMAFFMILSSIYFSADFAEPGEREFLSEEMIEVILLNEQNDYQSEINVENDYQHVYLQSVEIESNSTVASVINPENLFAQGALDRHEKEDGIPKSTSTSSSKMIGVFLILVGIILTAVPYIAWYLQIGWRLRGSEPSSLALAANRIGGVALLFIGVIFLIS